MSRIIKFIIRNGLNGGLVVSILALLMAIWFSASTQ